MRALTLLDLQIGAHVTELWMTVPKSHLYPWGTSQSVRKKNAGWWSGKTSIGSGKTQSRRSAASLVGARSLESTVKLRRF